MSGVEYSDGMIRQSSEPVPAEQGRSDAEPSGAESRGAARVRRITELLLRYGEFGATEGASRRHAAVCASEIDALYYDYVEAAIAAEPLSEAAQVVAKSPG